MSRPALSGGGNGQQYPRIQQQAQFQPGDHFYYSSDSVPQNPQQQPHIPPGAMAPVDQLSRHQPPTAVPRQHSTPPLPLGPGPYRSRSPSPHAHGKQPVKAGRYSPSSSQENLVLGNVNRIPGRSHSAIATVPQQTNGKLRKGTSVHSTIPSGRRPLSAEGRQEQNGTGEEDIPLAMWQQQRRR